MTRADIESAILAVANELIPEGERGDDTDVRRGAALIAMVVGVFAEAVADAVVRKLQSGAHGQDTED